MVPSGDGQLEGVAVVLEGDPVWTIHFMGALHCNILWCSFGFFCRTNMYVLLDLSEDETFNALKLQEEEELLRLFSFANTKNKRLKR